MKLDKETKEKIDAYFESKTSEEFYKKAVKYSIVETGDMKNKIENWQDVYKLPLKLDNYSGIYAWTDNDVMALTFDDYIVTEQDAKMIVNVINGDSEEKSTYNLSFTGCDFFIEGEYAFCVRGWGHLTGVGGLNLSEEKALEIQDEFIRYIYKKLT